MTEGEPTPNPFDEPPIGPEDTIHGTEPLTQDDDELDSTNVNPSLPGSKQFTVPSYLQPHVESGAINADDAAEIGAMDKKDVDKALEIYRMKKAKERERNRLLNKKKNE